MSIRLRMTLWYTGVLTATLLLFGTGLYATMRYTLYRDLRNELERASYLIYSRINVEQLPRFFVGSVVLDIPDLNAFQASNIFIQLVDNSGKLRGKSNNLGSQSIPMLQSHFDRAAAGEQPFFATVDEYDLLTMYTPIRLNGNFIGVLQVSGRTDGIQTFLHQLSLILGVTALFAVLLAATLGWFLARKALKSIDGVIDAANRIQEGRDLGLRIPYEGPPDDEIGRLTATINSMLERIQSAYEELDGMYRTQRRFVSDASHELRTPLTTIRGNVELLEKMWRTLLPAVKRPADPAEVAAGGGRPSVGPRGDSIGDPDGGPSGDSIRDPNGGPDIGRDCDPNGGQDGADAEREADLRADRPADDAVSGFDQPDGGDGVPSPGMPTRDGVGLDQDTVEMTVEAMRDIAAEAERMSRLINDLLSLARADAGYQMQKEPVELKPLVEDVVRRARFLPRKADWIPGDLSPLDGLFVYGNKDYLQQLLFIFLDNAFKYTPSGQVRLDVQRAGDQIGFRIRDTGIGMDKSEVPHIFDRFYRADPSRGKTGGTGLGLAIAKWIIDEHNGSVEVFTSLGKGTTFIVWLPLFFPRPDESAIMKENDSG